MNNVYDNNKHRKTKHRQTAQFGNSRVVAITAWLGLMVHKGKRRLENVVTICLIGDHVKNLFLRMDSRNKCLRNDRVLWEIEM